MTTIDKKLPQALFPVTTSSFLKLAHHAMHGSETWYAWVFERFHDNNKKNCLRHFFLQLLLHFSNLHTMQCMEVKLGTHVYFSVSMTTVYKKWPQALSPITTSSLLKLVNYAIHGSETWYACVFHRFHDNHEQKIASGTFPYNYSSLLKLANHNGEICTQVYRSVSMMSSSLPPTQ